MTYKLLQFLLIALFISACSSSKCRRKDSLPSYPGKVTDIVPDESKKTKKGKKVKVFVYKYDGSKQCQMGHPIPVKVMAQELEGIQVFSQQNKADGLMHVQMCGANTGQANVYEIYEDDLEKAASRGFKLWEFN